MFLVFEGLDGCGKSTLIKNYKNHLEALGKSVYLTREPGGTPLGEELRETLLTIKKNTDFKISPRAELLLYEASRAQHVDQIIRPKVLNGEVVLCDRFTASSVAFQAGGRALRTGDAEWLNAFATDQFKPTAQIFIDLDFENCQKRKSGMNQPLDRLESEKSEFHNQVYKSYQEQVQLNPSHWIVLDGQQSPEVLLSKLVEALQKFW
jgi:dTMP kinase